MKILPNQFNETNTYILGRYIANGCQCFDNSEIDEICKFENVPDNIKNEVLKAWEENKACEDEKHLDVFVCHEEETIRRMVACYGRDEDLDILVHDSCIDVRLEVIKHSRDKDLDILVNDPDCRIKVEVAIHGRGKDLDILVNDEMSFIRYEVFKHKRPQDLAKLDTFLLTDPWTAIRNNPEK